MKKLLEFGRKIKSKLTISTFRKPLAVTLGIILLINIVILAVAAFIANAIDINNVYFDNFIDAFCTGAIKWMVAPNSILSFVNENAKVYNGSLTLLCGLVVAVEMVLFSGIIIATITTALKTFIDKKMSAKGRLPLQNHIVILNWNSKVPEIILDLLQNGKKDNILILSNQERDHILSEIDSAILTSNRFKEKIKIDLIVRQGEPLLHSELCDISIEKASYIFIMAREDMKMEDDVNITNADLYSLKIMMSLADFNMSKNARVVIETEDDKSREMLDNLAQTVEGLKELEIIPLSFNKKLGQILGQVIIEPSLSQIYMDLFSFYGCEFHSFEDMSVEEYLDNYNGGVPIINLGRLFVLADDEEKMKSKREKPLSAYRSLKRIEEPEREHLTIITIAENKKTPYLIENLNIYKKENPNSFDIINCEKNDYEKLINTINNSKGKVKVLILSDDTANEESLDANVFLSLIALKKSIVKRDNVSYITEILDSKNLNSILDFNVQNAIVSNKLISLLLLQIAINGERDFFEGLLTIDSSGHDEIFDIIVNKVKNILDVNQNLTFSKISDIIRDIYYSFDKKIIPLGLIKTVNGKDEYIYFASNIDEEKQYILNGDDRLIYIKY